MNSGFPVQLISKLCCCSDGTTLELCNGSRVSEDRGNVWDGILRCGSCKAEFEINGGILNMLNGITLDDKSRHELQLRNDYAIKVLSKSTLAPGPADHENEDNFMEMIPTIEALSVNRDTTIFELGCGDGRYTVPLAGQCKFVLALDFSIEALKILQRRLQESQNVGLVLGDVTTVHVRAGSFDRVLSTLVSNLPTRDHRNAMYRLAANAIGQNGRFVFSTHNHGFRQRLKGVAKSGTYAHGDIYRYNFTVNECKSEIRPYFESIKATPIQIYLPFARRLRLPLVALSRFLERIPLINELGCLILCIAERQIRTAPNL